MNWGCKLFLLLVLFVLLLAYLEYCVWKDFNAHRLWNPELYHEVLHNRVPFLGNNLQQVNQGKQLAKESSLVICGLARDLSASIERTLDMMTIIGKEFLDYRILVFENDSQDTTRQKIQSASRNNTRIILLPCPEEKECRLSMQNMYEIGWQSTTRQARMAKIRNKYLSTVKQDYADWDYMLVVDMDIQGSTNLAGLFHSMGSDLPWDVIVTHGEVPLPGSFGLVTFQYDALAYCGGEADLIRCQTDPKNSLHYITFIGDQIKEVLFPSPPFIPVASAFNGMALYKISSIMHPTIFYPGDWCCEHVGLHSKMRDRGCHLYINPRWITYMGIQGPRDLIFRF